MKHLPHLLLLAGVAVAGCGSNNSNDMDLGVSDDMSVTEDSHVPEDQGGTDDQGSPDQGGTGDQGTTDDQGTTGDLGTEEDASVGPTCVESQVGAGAQNVEICALENPTRHVRIAGLLATRTHASTQLFVGLGSPAGSQANLAAGEFKLQLYGGGQPQPPPDLSAYFGADGVEFEGADDFINTASTICLDIHPGSATTRAVVVMWLDGENGADCEDTSTLTFETRYGHAWAPTTGALNDDGIYFYQSGGTQTPVVTLSDATVLAYEDVPPPDCTVTDLTASPTSRYVQLCELDAPVRHVRIEGLQTEAMHGTVSFLTGYAAPANAGAGPAAPAAGQLRAQFYIGGPRLDVGSNGGSAQADGDYAFLGTASTVCFDIHDGTATTPPYFVMWRDGENDADCEDRSTLTAESAFTIVNTSLNMVPEPVFGALDQSGPDYLYLYRSGNPTFGSGNATSVWLSTTPATDAEDVAPVTP